MTQQPAPAEFFGQYYDGRTARVRSVRCTVADGQLRIEGDGIERTETVRDVVLSDQLGSAPRKLTLPDGASIEAPLSAALSQALAQAGGSTSWVARLESRWQHAVLALLASIAVIAAGYFWGLPMATKLVAQRLPAGIIDGIGERTLGALDGNMFKPSSLAPGRQQRLIERVLAMHGEQEALPRHRLLFRQGQMIGANALALPDGSIVVTDQLVALARDDDEVLAVIGHELGHLHHRHALRGLIQGSVVAAVVAWYAGDISAIAVGLPTLLLQTGYSRDFEREADRYGARFLLRNGLSPELLASMLEKLAGAQARAGGRNYLSTHPDTQERAATLRRFRAENG